MPPNPTARALDAQVAEAVAKRFLLTPGGTARDPRLQLLPSATNPRTPQIDLDIWTRILGRKVRLWISGCWQNGLEWQEYQWNGREDREWCQIPHYSTDLTAAYAMESRLATLGLQTRYATELRRIVSTMDPGELGWRMAHATPEERCRAALATVQTQEVAHAPD